MLGRVPALLGGSHWASPVDAIQRNKASTTPFNQARGRSFA